jgi:UDP-N-acetylglucosamine 2-epimerase (non-hydrolysing)
MEHQILSVVGARPNFIKLAPFVWAVNEYNSNAKNNRINHIIVHTGQHYDDSMSSNFFQDLNIPSPDYNLNIGSGSHAEQVGMTMIEFEKVVQKINPDWIVVYGDVNATLACSVTAKKERLKCCHIEAGLRSGDLRMPEEINRLVTDRVSDLLLTPDHLSTQNLIKEGVDEKKIKFVGNIMIDSFEKNRVKAAELDYSTIVRTHLTNNSRGVSLDGRDSVVLTMHRPSNVDDKLILEPILRFISFEIPSEVLVIWPIHPRTKKQIEFFNLQHYIEDKPNLLILNPVGHIEMLNLCMNSTMIITDSGGLQEEATVLGKTCITLRENTERPVTLKEHGGVSVLVGHDIDALRTEFNKALKNPEIKTAVPEFWDGKTGQRCLSALLNSK